jgi:hypothetical protein
MAKKTCGIPFGNVVCSHPAPKLRDLFDSQQPAATPTVAGLSEAAIIDDPQQCFFQYYCRSPPALVENTLFLAVAPKILGAKHRILE